jgi:hypothetical protein
LSAQSINSGDDEAPKPLRKTESSISSNEELGPATVKARIAQIGSKIPAPRAGIIVNEETRAPQIIGKNGTEFEETNAPIPTQQAEAMKTRAKGPMRRAPTQIGPPKAPHKDGGTTTKELPPRGSSEIPQGNAIEREVSKTTAATQFKAPPPAVPPKQKGHSIFSSSSSEDEMTRLKTTKQNARSHQQKQQPLTTTKEEKTIIGQHVPPVLPKKNGNFLKIVEWIFTSFIEPAKQRKGLFDDTDSDF